MSSPHNLIAQFSSKEFENSIENILSFSNKISKEVKSQIYNELQLKLNHLKSSIEDIVIKGDTEEFSNLLVIMWLENRLEWSRYNSQMQYQTSSNGKANLDLMAKGSCISLVIDIIERYLDKNDLHWLLKIAANPVLSASYRHEQSSKLVDNASKYGKVSKSILVGQVELLQELAAKKINTNIIEKLENEVRNNIGKVNSTIFINYQDIVDFIEATVFEKTEKSKLQFNVRSKSNKVSVGFPPEVVKFLKEILNDYLIYLVENSIETKVEERKGKSDFININWDLNFCDDHYCFSISDDGLGKVNWKPDNSLFKDIEISYDIINSLNGSTLNLKFYFYDVAEFLVFEVLEKGLSQKYAINSKLFVKELNEIGRTEKLVKLLKFTSQATKDNKVTNIIKNSDGDLFIFKCNKNLGKIFSRTYPSNDNKCLGEIEFNQEKIKLLDIETISKDEDVTNEVLKILL